MTTETELLTEEKVDQKNMLYQPLIIIVVTLLILMIISLIPADTKVAGLQVKSIDMISDVKPD